MNNHSITAVLAVVMLCLGSVGCAASAVDEESAPTIEVAAPSVDPQQTREHVLLARQPPVPATEPVDIADDGSADDSDRTGDIADDGDDGADDERLPGKRTPPTVTL